MPILKLKSKGKDVEALQKALNKLVAAKLTPDGVFGKLTHAALVKFQKKNSLKSDGVAGASTLAVIGLGPSLRIPKMKVKDCKDELKYYKDINSLQGTGGPEQIDRELIEVKKALRAIEANFVAMAREVTKIQKDVEKEHSIVLAALTEIVKHQTDYASYVKKNDIENAAAMASGAEKLFALFTKAEKSLDAVQDKQQKIFTGKFFALMDKTLS